MLLKINLLSYHSLFQNKQKKKKKENEDAMKGKESLGQHIQEFMNPYRRKTIKKNKRGKTKKGDPDF